jgi:hypothetical protein
MFVIEASRDGTIDSIVEKMLSDRRFVTLLMEHIRIKFLGT